MWLKITPLMNGAVTADAQLDDGIVTVNTSVTNDSFFAKILTRILSKRAQKLPRGVSRRMEIT